METSSNLLSQNTFQTEICWACSVEVSWNGLLTLSWLVGQRTPLFAVTVLLLPVSSACAVWAEQLSLLLPLIIIAATFWITVNSSSHLSDRDAEQEHQRLRCVCRWTSRMPPDWNGLLHDDSENSLKKSNWSFGFHVQYSVYLCLIKGMVNLF